ncbi:MAG: hypothetical protein ACE5MB_02225 [Anaerolineae bacterium]
MGRKAAVPLILLVIVALIMLASCTPLEPEGRVMPPATPTPGIKMTPAIPPEIPSEVESVVRLAREDLARRVGISPAEIAVVSVKEVMWRNSSLGCPQPGQMYLQVITPGYRVILRARDQEYEYHTDRGRRVILCTKGRGPEPTATVEGGILPRPSPTVEKPFFPGTPVALDQAQETIGMATADLAKRLGIPSHEIRVIVVRGWEWGDTNLGCPSPDASYTSVATPGYVIVLFAQGREYEYHTDLEGRVVYCPGGPWTTHPHLWPTPSHPLR